MKSPIAVGIDIGTYKIKVMVCESVKTDDRVLPRIIGTGTAESKGLRHGYIVNHSEAAKSIAAAVSQAEKVANVKIKKAYISVGGSGLASVISVGSVAISRADSEITDLDLENIIEAAQKDIPPAAILNRKIIHTIPVQYKVDGIAVDNNRPLGMRGVRLDAKVLFITTVEQHLDDLIQAVEDAGVEVAHVAASPLAASLVTLTKTQKMAGCLLANIGAETVTIVVYENNIPMSLEVFPIGSTDLTNDIALGFRIPLEEAEQIKTGTLSGAEFPRRKIEEIISARLSDIFELIEAHLKKIGRNGLLPAGIIITGGGSGVNPIEELAKTSLRLPAKIGAMSFGNGKEPSINRLRDATWSVAYGLCILSMDSGADSPLKDVGALGKKMVGWFKQFLP